ncbi:BNR-4 repeat-containing protein [Aeoliella mucimassa]|nr:BNR-4 repeat-containing protein [Aeoliella mucimassa]
MLSTASAQISATPANGFQGIWYEVTSGGGSAPNKYGGGLGTYPQQNAPMAVYSEAAQKTFFGISLDIDPSSTHRIGHAISYYDHVTGMVARPQIWVDTATSDAHDSPVLSIDDEGYLYLFSSTHGEARRSYIHRSSEQYSIDSIDELLDYSAEDMAVFGSTAGEPRFSYAGGWYLPNAPGDEKFLLLHTRYIDGDRDLFYSTSPDADTWTTRQTFSEIEAGQYQTSWVKDDGRTVGTIFNIHPEIGNGSDYRTDLYYAETGDLGATWQNAAGLQLSTPFTERSADALVYDSVGDERVYLKDINYDSEGNPVILFVTSPTHIPGTETRTVKTAYYDDGWVIRDVMTTDHNYDHGSLYVEGDTWRIIAPFIDGPQQYGTGGQIGMWTSDNQGESWVLEHQLTNNDLFNQGYVQRPLNAQADFYGLWADGDAWEPSPSNFYFTTQAGDVYRLPYDMTTEFALPELMSYGTPPILATGALNLLYDGITIPWQIENELVVADVADGSLEVRLAATVSSASGVIAADTGTTGSVRICDDSSAWNVSGDLTVGDLGNGSLVVESGGLLTSSSAYLGRQNGASGLVQVASAQWQSTGSVYVGGSDVAGSVDGASTLRVEEDGLVQIAGTLQVWQTGAVELHGGTLRVGALAIDSTVSGDWHSHFNWTNGILEVTESSLVVDAASTSMNSQLTLGSGMQLHLANDNALVIGDQNQGSVVVDSGGQIISGSAYLGRQTGGSGTVLVTGSGSQWQSNGSVYVGGSDLAGSLGGASTLLVEQDGLVQIAGNLQVWQSGAVGLHGGTLRVGGFAIETLGGSNPSFDWTSGTLEVTDSSLVIDSVSSSLGSELTLTSGMKLVVVSEQDLIIGDQGEASLVVESGGKVTSGTAYLGRQAGASASVRVTDSGSQWTAAGVYIGGDQSNSGGSGELFIDYGGVVEIAGALQLWNNASVAINGGTLICESLTVESGGTFEFNSGKLVLPESTRFAVGEALEEAMGGSYLISPGCELQIDGTATLQSSFTIAGGTLSVGAISNSQLLRFESGVLHLTQDDFAISKALLTNSTRTVEARVG